MTLAPSSYAPSRPGGAWSPNGIPPAGENRTRPQDELVQLGRATLSAYFKALDVENAKVLETDVMRSVADFYVKNVLGDFSWKLNVSSVAELIGFFSVYCSSCVERKCPKTCVHR